MRRLLGLLVLALLVLAATGKLDQLKGAFRFVGSKLEKASGVELLIAAALGAVLGFIVGRFRAQARTHAFQNRGEALLSRAVTRSFLPPDYHLLNHVTLRLKDGTTQIDHILVSRFGVFVIETKDHKGWIFANASDRYWTQVLYNVRFKFQNPLRQNYKHVAAVRELLDFIPSDVIRPIVVFTGRAVFKTDLPEGVFRMNGFLDHIAAHSTEVMSLNRVQFCVGRLENTRLSVTKSTDVEHVELLRRRHGFDD